MPTGKESLNPATPEYRAENTVDQKREVIKEGLSAKDYESFMEIELIGTTKNRLHDKEGKRHFNFIVSEKWTVFAGPLSHDDLRRMLYSSIDDSPLLEGWFETENGEIRVHSKEYTSRFKGSATEKDVIMTALTDKIRKFAMAA